MKEMPRIQRPPQTPSPLYQPPQKQRIPPPPKHMLLGVMIGGLIVLLLVVNATLSRRNDTTPVSTDLQQTQTQMTQETTSNQATPEATPSPIPTIAPISLSGVGQQASHQFQLQQGLAIFTLTHDGSSNFIVHLLDSNGQVIDYLVNEIGSFEGSKAESIQNADTYVLDIQADGKWTVTIQQPRPIAAPYTTSFSGKGQTATQLFSMQSGLKIIKMTHYGTSNFIVHILDSNGNVVDYLVNEIGKFDGSKAEGIPNDGIYLFDIEADGNWTISIQ